MTAFPTPEPISVTVTITAGQVHLVAAEVTETTVEVEPTNPDDTNDIEVAKRTRVDYTRGKLTIRTPTSLRHRRSAVREGGAITVTVTVPEGSRFRAGSAWANFHIEGRLGACRIDTVSGVIQLDRTEAVNVTAVRGDLTVGRAGGPVKVTTRTGSIWFDEIDGSAVIKNDHGECTIGSISGPLRLLGTSGEFTVDRASGGVWSKTAYGGVRIGELLGGSAVLASASGEIEVGVPRGTAVRMDLSTVGGVVYNGLTEVDRPSGAEKTIDVNAHTFDGDIVIRRTEAG